MNRGAVEGGVRIWLRVEGLMLLAASLSWYAASDLMWGWFALLFLAPDVSFAAYLAGPRVGAIGYNIAHSLTLPLLLAVAGVAVLVELLPVAATWIAHIGFDRALGYGLKYETAFADTHLGRIGRTS